MLAHIRPEPLSPAALSSLRGQDNTVVWHEQRIAWFFTGKTGNSSIKAAILSANGGVDPARSVHADPRLSYVTNAEARWWMQEHGYRGLAVVRNPFDRLASFWADKIAGRVTANYDHLGIHPGMEFDATIEVVSKLHDMKRDTHLTPQVELLSDAHGRLYPDQVIRFDQLAEDWAFLRRWHDLPALPHLNKSRVEVPVVSEGHRQLVERRYADDYDTFNYMRVS